MTDRGVRNTPAPPADNAEGLVMAGVVLIGTGIFVGQPDDRPEAHSPPI